MAIRSLKTGQFSRSALVGNPVIMPGSYESIATVSISSNGQSATFSNIPQTYTHLQIRMLHRGTDTGANDTLYLRFNSLAPSSGYRDHYLRGDGSSATASSGANNFLDLGNPGGNGNTTGIFGVSIIDILDYKDTNKYKTVRTLMGYDANGSGRIQFRSGFLTTTTNAITDMDISTLAGGFVTYSSIALYGVN